MHKEKQVHKCILAVNVKKKKSTLMEVCIKCSGDIREGIFSKNLSV